MQTAIDSRKYYVTNKLMNFYWVITTIMHRYCKLIVHNLIILPALADLSKFKITK